MPEYTLTITDQMDADIQYLIDNKIPSPLLPPVFVGALSLDTIQEFLQSIIDRNIGFIIIQANNSRDQEILRTVKADNTLLDQVNTAVNIIRDSKLKVTTPVTEIKP